MVQLHFGLENLARGLGLENVAQMLGISRSTITGTIIFVLLILAICHLGDKSESGKYLYASLGVILATAFLEFGMFAVPLALVFAYFSEKIIVAHEEFDQISREEEELPSGRIIVVQKRKKAK